MNMRINEIHAGNTISIYETSLIKILPSYI